MHCVRIRHDVKVVGSFATSVRFVSTMPYWRYDTDDDINGDQHREWEQQTKKICTEYIWKSITASGRRTFNERTNEPTKTLRDVVSDLAQTNTKLDQNKQWQRWMLNANTATTAAAKQRQTASNGRKKEWNVFIDFSIWFFGNFVYRRRMHIVSCCIQPLLLAQRTDGVLEIRRMCEIVDIWPCADSMGTRTHCTSFAAVCRVFSTSNSA